MSAFFFLRPPRPSRAERLKSGRKKRGGDCKAGSASGRPRQLLFLHSGKSSRESNLPVCYCIQTTLFHGRARPPSFLFVDDSAPVHDVARATDFQRISHAREPPLLFGNLIYADELARVLRLGLAHAHVSRDLFQIPSVAYYMEIRNWLADSLQVKSTRESNESSTRSVSSSLTVDHSTIFKQEQCFLVINVYDSLRDQ